MDNLTKGVTTMIELILFIGFIDILSVILIIGSIIYLIDLFSKLINKE